MKAFQANVLFILSQFPGLHPGLVYGDLSGLLFVILHFPYSQGCTLGWYITTFQAFLFVILHFPYSQGLHPGLIYCDLSGLFIPNYLILNSLIFNSLILNSLILISLILNSSFLFQNQTIIQDFCNVSDLNCGISSF